MKLLTKEQEQKLIKNRELQEAHPDKDMKNISSENEAHFGRIEVQVHCRML